MGLPAWSISDLEHHGDRPVVDERHSHAGAEDASLGAHLLAEPVIQRLGVLTGRRLDIARARPLTGVAVQRELADAEDLAIAERLVHLPAGVVEDPERT